MRAVIYARYSSHNQREESIDDQIRVCREYATKEGYEVVGCYCDRAMSGTTDRRNDFQRMIADSALREWELVIVYKTDRFSRNRYDSAINKRKLKKNGVRVVCAAESIPDGADGILMESILEGMAEYYSANLGENIKRGHHGNALKCHPNGARRYGYDIAGAHIDENGRYRPGDHYEINRGEAKAIRVMYRARAQGYSLEQVASRLEQDGFRSRKGEPIPSRMVSRLIRNPIYKGVYLYGDVEIPGGIPAIVSEREWDAAQNPKVSKRGMPKVKRKYRHDLEGAIFGDYEALSHVKTDHRHRWIWLCKCHKCGSYREFYAWRLSAGLVDHCVCYSPHASPSKRIDG